MTAAAINSNEVSSRRLWFGFAGAATAWVLAGALDGILAWYACLGKEFGATLSSPLAMHLLLGVITFALLAVAIAGGVISFKNWSALSEADSFATAEGRGRKQFMALSGVFISAFLGIGIVWFAIPIYLLGVCVRAR